MSSMAVVLNLVFSVGDRLPPGLLIAKTEEGDVVAIALPEEEPDA